MSITFKELNERPIELISKTIHDLSGHRYNHIPEAQIDTDYIPWDHEDNMISIHYLKNFMYDGRRCWKLGKVYYGGQLVMFIANAGREGDDYSSRAILNKSLFINMCKYIHDTYNPLLFNEINENDIFNLNDDASNFKYFYDQDLDGFFQRYDF